MEVFHDLSGFSSDLFQCYLAEPVKLAVVTDPYSYDAGERSAYPYWCVEKGYARFAGPREDSDAWRRRARGWIRVMHCDIIVSMAVYTLATVAFYMLGADDYPARLRYQRWARYPIRADPVPRETRPRTPARG